MADYAVFIHTSRNPLQVDSWLAEHGVPTTTDLAEGTPAFWNEQDCVLVTNRKLPAVAYLDDRAVRFTTWPDALAQLAGGA